MFTCLTKCLLTSYWKGYLICLTWAVLCIWKATYPQKELLTNTSYVQQHRRTSDTISKWLYYRKMSESVRKGCWCGATREESQKGIEYDHLNESHNVIHLSKKSVPIKKYLVEVPKCRCLCYKCHKMRSNAQMQGKKNYLMHWNSKNNINYDWNIWIIILE